MKRKLPKFALSYSKKDENWNLSKVATKEVIKTFTTKSDAVEKGVLQKAIGGRGSVQIKKMDGKIQEERTFPRKDDPKKSKG